MLKKEVIAIGVIGAINIVRAPLKLGGWIISEAQHHPFKRSIFSDREAVNRILLCFQDSVLRLCTGS